VDYGITAASAGRGLIGLQMVILTQYNMKNKDDVNFIYNFNKEPIGPFPCPVAQL